MSDLVVLLFIAGIIGGFLIYAWPLVVFFGSFIFIAWVIGNFFKGIDENKTYHREMEASLVYRADKQHAEIMSGDDVAGTYGIYPPPQGLR